MDGWITGMIFDVPHDIMVFCTKAYLIKNATYSWMTTVCNSGPVCYTNSHNPFTVTLFIHVHLWLEVIK